MWSNDENIRLITLLRAIADWYLDHADTCSFNKSLGEQGDFCSCKIDKVKARILETITALKEERKVTNAIL